MSVLEGEKLVLNASWPEGRLAVFEIVTGQLLWEVPVTESSAGLACFPALQQDPGDDDDTGDDDWGDDDQAPEDDDDDPVNVCGVAPPGGAGGAIALVLLASIGWLGRRR